MAKANKYSNTVVIRAENVRKTFGALTAVDSISFTVKKGECFGILGPNGAGKTTTIRMLYGFSPITGGRLEILNTDISQGLVQIKFRIGVCQQENNLDPDLTVQQNLEVYARYFDIPLPKARRKAEELLGFLGLNHRKPNRVAELSGGMMRRLVLARALINDPELLILDEPTTGLDPQSRHQVWERLNELRSRGITILLTTHYMDEAAHLCDRLVIMDHGRILVEGEPLKLIRDHVGHNVIEVNEPNPELRDYICSHNFGYEDLGHRLIVYSRANDALFHKLSEEYCREGCVFRMATLEDVFLRLTGRELRE
ncbi:MAG: ATP-binding cassette domain-containing protein [Deltaproteobacteria bacterium]|nr:ATP-binding cassette domain-containing protein [Deltaproteobacteria bacterium]